MKFLALLSSIAFAGSFVGNPADRLGPHSGEPWSSGSTVFWCSPQANEIKPALDQAVARWQQYRQKKQIPIRPQTWVQKACDGQEDLRLEMREEIQPSLSYSSSSQSQRLIWFSRQLAGATLLTQLVHQIGHVLGTEHIPGTVMAESVPQNKDVIQEIDGTRELYLCRTCDFRVVGRRGTYSESPGRAEVSGPNGFALTFIGDLGEPALNESRVFGDLRSRGLSRLAKIGSTEVVVQRNFANLVEIRDLKSAEILFQAP